MTRLRIIDYARFILSPVSLPYLTTLSNPSIFDSSLCTSTEYYYSRYNYSYPYSLSLRQNVLLTKLSRLHVRNVYPSLSCVQRYTSDIKLMPFNRERAYSAGESVSYSGISLFRIWGALRMELRLSRSTVSNESRVCACWQRLNITLRWPRNSRIYIPPSARASDFRRSPSICLVSDTSCGIASFQDTRLL